MPNEIAGTNDKGEEDDNKGWMAIIRRPHDDDPSVKNSFLINTNGGRILIHYYDEHNYIFDHDQKNFERRLHSHTQVQVAPFESGHMIASGQRFDHPSSSPTT